MKKPSQFNNRLHWEKIYSKLPHEKMGWYEPELTFSLDYIRKSGINRDERIIDVGGGASTLVEDLLEEGFSRIAIFDLSHSALQLSRNRLGGRAKRVKWIVGDITETRFRKNCFALWHDRAVFHFLTESEQIESYLLNLRRSLRKGGHFIIATFSLEAPPKCSGLPVKRYSPESLRKTLGTQFQPLNDCKTLHLTPGGVKQMYLYCHFRKTE